jgi:hypothetical protein
MKRKTRAGSSTPPRARRCPAAPLLLEPTTTGSPPPPRPPPHRPTKRREPTCSLSSKVREAGGRASPLRRHRVVAGSSSLSPPCSHRRPSPRGASRLWTPASGAPAPCLDSWEEKLARAPRRAREQSRSCRSPASSR